ncbi:hypothetical protein JCM5296_000926 [Sporobolomyces johnsonii]
MPALPVGATESSGASAAPASTFAPPSSDLESAWARPADESWSSSSDAELARLVLEQNDQDGPAGIDWSAVAKGLSGKRRTGRQVEGRWSVLTAAVTEALSVFDYVEGGDDEQQPKTSQAADPSTSQFSPEQRWTPAEDAALSSAVADFCPPDPSPSDIATTYPRFPDVAWTLMRSALTSIRTPRSLYQRFLTHHLPYPRSRSSTTYLSHREWSAEEDEELANAVDELGGRAKLGAAGWKDDGFEATAKWTIVRGSVRQGAREVKDVVLRWGEVQRDGGFVAEQRMEGWKGEGLPTYSTERDAVPVANGAARPQELQATPSHASSSAGLPPMPIIQSDQRDPPSTQSGKSKNRSWEGFTSEEDEKIRELRGSGMTWKGVAHELGRTHRSCERRWSRLKKAGRVSAPPAPRSIPAQPSQESTPVTYDALAFSFVPTPREAHQDEVPLEDHAKETGRTKTSEEARWGIPTSLAGSLASLETVSTSEVFFSSEDDVAILRLEQQYPRRFKAISGLLTPLRHAKEVKARWEYLTSPATSNRSSAPTQLPPPCALSPPVPRAAAPSHQSDSFVEPPAKRPRIDSSSSTTAHDAFLSANVSSSGHTEPVTSGSNEAEPSTSSPSHPFTTPHSAVKSYPTVAYASGSTAADQPVRPNPGPAPVARARPKPAEKPRRKVARVADFAHLLPGALEGLRCAFSHTSPPSGADSSSVSQSLFPVSHPHSGETRKIPREQALLLLVWNFAGVPWEWEKQLFGHHLVILGHLVNGSELSACLPADARSDFRDYIEAFLADDAPVLVRWQRLAGYAQWVCTTLPFARFALNSVYDKMKGKTRRLAPVRRNKAVERDMRWLAQELIDAPPLSFLDPALEPWGKAEADLMVYTDACLAADGRLGSGLGFWFRRSPSVPRSAFFARISPPLVDIVYAEALAVHSAITHVVNTGLAGRRLLVWTDSSPSVYAFDSGRASGPLLDLVRSAYGILNDAQVDLRVRHIPGVANTTADNLSRMLPHSLALGFKSLEQFHPITPSVSPSREGADQ